MHKDHRSPHCVAFRAALGQALKQARERRYYSANGVMKAAKELGFTSNRPVYWLHRIEKGSQHCTCDQLVWLADFYRVPVESLLANVPRTITPNSTIQGEAA